MSEDTLPQTETVFHVSAKICKDIGRLVFEIESLFCSHNLLAEKNDCRNSDIQNMDLVIQSIEELAKLLETLGDSSNTDILYDFHFASESLNLEWMKELFLKNMDGSKDHVVEKYNPKVVIF